MLPAGAVTHIEGLFPVEPDVGLVWCHVRLTPGTA